LDLQNHVFDHNTARTFLEKHGQLLQEKGQEYYYEMRSEFNKNADSLYFLFINRSCFNGMIRFNSKGEFNVPFCRKPNRFSKSYITKIVNQIERIEKLIWEHGNNWVFLCQSWQQTFADVNGVRPLVYLDPPYVDRHATYFDDWTDEKNDELFHFLSICPHSFVLSNWKKNQWRTNDSLDIFSNDHRFRTVTREHFYFVGAKLENRNPIEECLIANF
jgi:DNA adenine methylase